MKIKYNLLRYHLTDKHEYWAQVYSNGTMDKDMFIDSILQRRTSFSRPELIAFFNLFEESVIKAVTDGYTLALPLFSTSLSISGLFRAHDDLFDHRRHELKLNLHKGPLFRNATESIRLEKSHRDLPYPYIKQIKATDNTIQVYGCNLKIIGDNPACGLWFVCESRQATKLPNIFENKPKRLIASIPSTITPGKYNIKVVTQWTTSGATLKNPRESQPMTHHHRPQ